MLTDKLKKCKIVHNYTVSAGTKSGIEPQLHCAINVNLS